MRAPIVTNKRSPMVHVSTEVPRPLGEAFENIARANGITKAELLRRLIRALVEDKTKIPKAAPLPPTSTILSTSASGLFWICEWPALVRPNETPPRRGGCRGRGSRTPGVKGGHKERGSVGAIPPTVLSSFCESD